ncbi:MAG: ExsB family transcriptional regulator [Candidatus Omnitrophica bacterium]|nr:ExsB family transcriptional regulator [Candidatus Omnitrophota bacterium]
MEIKELKTEQLVPNKFIEEKVQELCSVVGEGLAVNALSGGVDSAAVTMLGHQALGARLKTYFIENGLMRQDEPERIAAIFKGLGVAVEIIDAKTQFFKALAGIDDPEAKREAITQTFYKDVFGLLVRKSNAQFLLQGTNYTDVEETVAGVKRQHNILEQLGIDTQKQFGYKVLEPIIQLRKSGVRKLAQALGLPEEIYNRPPFPGPALATRIVGAVSPERIEVVRHATKIVEEELKRSGAFQYLAILHQDKFTGVRNGKREFGLQIEVRSWESKDAVVGSPSRLSFGILEKVAARITTEIPVVFSVTYNITKKPPSTIEAV